ncbi:uncharacterized protein CLUP02_17391 [Colletotrichum lupini]|uniref:Uncharacterized protein n=1 Tax=Colletotrichum lupini TaxID=145971 RepID=A0A9Q8SEF3_9PEZI|nr:uncharacterized protein CLUP02_17391 [Colletotrichum lupini]UQC75882.1 hypothetical protein CLUP02_17391 [Colletotrichum lupini]
MHLRAGAGSTKVSGDIPLCHIRLDTSSRNFSPHSFPPSTPTTILRKREKISASAVKMGCFRMDSFESILLGKFFAASVAPIVHFHDVYLTHRSRDLLSARTNMHHHLIPRHYGPSAHSLETRKESNTNCGSRLINQVNISSSELPVYTFFGYVNFAFFPSFFLQHLHIVDYDEQPYHSVLLLNSVMITHIPKTFPTAGNQSWLFSVRAVATNIVGKRASTAYPFNYVMPAESSSRTGVPLRRDEEGGGVGSLGSRHLTSVLSFSVPRSEVQGLRGRLG